MTLFLEGQHPDIPIGPWTTPSGEAVIVVRLGLVEKSVMKHLYPEIEGMVGPELTQVVYSK